MRQYNLPSFSYVIPSVPHTGSNSGVNVHESIHLNISGDIVGGPSGGPSPILIVVSSAGFVSVINIGGDLGRHVVIGGNVSVDVDSVVETTFLTGLGVKTRGDTSVVGEEGIVANVSSGRILTG